MCESAQDISKTITDENKNGWATCIRYVKMLERERTRQQKIILLKEGNQPLDTGPLSFLLIARLSSLAILLVVVVACRHLS